MSLTKKENPAEGYEYRPASSKIVAMEESGIIFRGGLGQLMVKMKRRKAEPLSKACKREAKMVDASLRRKGYLLKLQEGKNRPSHWAILERI